MSAVEVKFKGNPVELMGTRPKVGDTIEFGGLVQGDLSELNSESLLGSVQILNVFPSVDTGVCAASVRRFNEEAGKLTKVQVLNVSMDLPFALSRFCGAEGLTHVRNLSAFRSRFGEKMGLVMGNTPLKGLLARSVFVLDSKNQLIHFELVPEITSEPNYEAALEAARRAV